MKSIKKIILLSLTLIMGITLVACKSNEGGNGANNGSNKASELGEIIVVSREDGSGTRGAFTEITGVLEKDDQGNERDKTYEEALIQNSTNGVMQTVSKDVNSIGYISLGSVDNSIKTLSVDNIKANEEDILKGSYAIARPFILATKGEAQDLAKDFIEFITSEQGQAISQKMGYVKIKDVGVYEKNSQEGKLTVAGSTSVTPVIEKLSEAYEAMYPNVDIEIQSTGSSAGIQATIDGAAQIGMSSRELKEKEVAELNPVTIAVDGIAIIVNNENPIEDISLENVKKVFTGEITQWSDLLK